MANPGLKTKLKALFHFQTRIIVPAVICALILGIASSTVHSSSAFIASSIGSSFLFCAPLFHYFIYEVRNPNGYYFYYNLGLSRKTLWLSTVITGFTTYILTCII